MALFNKQANQVADRSSCDQRADDYRSSKPDGERKDQCESDVTSVRLPLVPLERALAWRMVRDSLYENALGLSPMEKYVIGEAISGDYQPTRDFTTDKSPDLSISDAEFDGFDLSRWLKPQQSVRCSLVYRQQLVLTCKIF